jgi:hypothetical protein
MMHTWANGEMDGWMDGLMHDAYMGKWRNGWMDGWIDA